MFCVLFCHYILSYVIFIEFIVFYIHVLPQLIS